MAGTWVRITYEGESEGLFVFVARIDGTPRESIFNVGSDDFVRFDYVRWLEGAGDDADRPEFRKNEEDDESGSDHFIYLRQRTIIQVEPVREPFAEFWNATAGEEGALW